MMPLLATIYEILKVFWLLVCMCDSALWTCTHGTGCKISGEDLMFIHTKVLVASVRGHDCQGASTPMGLLLGDALLLQSILVCPHPFVGFDVVQTTWLFVVWD